MSETGVINAVNHNMDSSIVSQHVTTALVYFRKEEYENANKELAELIDKLAQQSNDEIGWLSVSTIIGVSYRVMKSENKNIKSDLLNRLVKYVNQPIKVCRRHITIRSRL